MRKQVFGRHFKRDTNERKAMFKSLASALVMHERIETTEEKAKAIRGSVEKMVTKAKKRDNVMAVRLLSPELTSPAVKKMIASIAPRFSTRDGGYTRIIKKGNRFNDNASMVLLEWVEKASAVAVDIIAPAASVKKSVKANAASEAVVVKKAVAKKPVAKKAPAKEKKA
jgi:large subunit ribosomal protein L17